VALRVKVSDVGFWAGFFDHMAEPFLGVDLVMHQIENADFLAHLVCQSFFKK
jgi:hypothetical protein